MEMQSLVCIESMCGCNIPGHPHGSGLEPWKHLKGCQLYEPPEPSPGAEPYPYEDDDIELTSSVWIKSNCACVGCNLHLDEYPASQKPSSDQPATEKTRPKQVLPHEHDTDCHFYIPEPSPDHEPYPEPVSDFELTALVLIESLCACEPKPSKPHEHREDCEMFEEASVSFSLSCLVVAIQLRKSRTFKMI